MKKIFTAAAFICSFHAAAFCAAHPAWIDGADPKYPQSQYMTGVGSADDQGTAKDRARAEISKIFSTRITVESNVSASEQTAQSDGRQTSSFSQSVSQNLQAASTKMLEGTVIAEAWQDPETKQWFALALLGRSDAVAAIREKIINFDDQASRLAPQLDDADKMTGVRAAMKISALLKAREPLASDLKVLDNTAGVTPPFDIIALKNEISKIKASIDIAVSMSGEGSRQLASGIIKSLTRQGLAADEGAGKPDINVSGEVKTERVYDSAQQSKWQGARSSAVISVTETASGKTIAGFEASSRQWSANYNEAVRRSLLTLGDDTAEQIMDNLAEYFVNQ